MSFDVHIRKDVGNEIISFVPVTKKFNVATLNITNGLLKKGSYQIPIEHILFIKEV